MKPTDPSGPTPPTSLLSRRAAWALLALIVALGAGVRLWGITERGPMIWDEGLYHDEGAWIYTGFRGLARSLDLKLEERRTGQDLWKAEDQFRAIGDQQWPFTLWSNRIGRATENAVAMAFVGAQPWVGPLVSAIYGIAGILLIYVLAARWWGRDAGVAGALTLAVMGWHWVYSREGFVETDATFFMVLAIAVFLRSARNAARHSYWGMFAAGVLWGVALTIQFRWASFALILVGGELVHAWLFRRGFWVHVARLALLVIGILIPNLLFEVPYYVAHVVARHFDMKPPFYTYIQTLIVHTIVVVKSALHPTPRTWLDWLTFPHGMWTFSGPLMLAISTAAFAVAVGRAWPGLRRMAQSLRPSASRAVDALSAPARERMLLELTMLIAVVQPLLKNVTLPRPRYHSFTLMIVALMTGAMVAALVRWSREGRLRLAPRAVLAAALVIIAANVYKPVALFPRMALGYADAVEWMRAHGGVRHVSSAMEVSKAWAGPHAVPKKLPRSIDELRADYERGYRFFLVDHWGPLSRQFWYQEGYYVAGVSEIAWDVLKTADEVRKYLEPVAVIDNPIGGTVQPIFEMNFRVDLSLSQVREGILAKASKIYIYDLAQLFGPGGALHERVAETAPAAS